MCLLELCLGLIHCSPLWSESHRLLLGFIKLSKSLVFLFILFRVAKAIIQNLFSGFVSVSLTTVRFITGSTKSMPFATSLFTTFFSCKLFLSLFSLPKQSKSPFLSELWGFWIYLPELQSPWCGTGPSAQDFPAIFPKSISLLVATPWFFPIYFSFISLGSGLFIKYTSWGYRHCDRKPQTTCAFLNPIKLTIKLTTIRFKIWEKYLFWDFRLFTNERQTRGFLHNDTNP